MKKVFVIFTISVLLIFVILLVSCSLGISSMKKEFFTRRGFLNSNDREIGAECFEKVIEAIENQDSTALKSLFSDKALKEAQNMDKAIEELFDFYQGYMLSSDDGGGLGVFGEQNADGRGFVTKEMVSMWDVETSEKKYHFAIRSFVQDNEFLDNIDVYALYIVKPDRLDESVADWWMKDGVWIPGIAIHGKGESLKPV